MVIRFLCPGGHKVHCPDDQAGRAAKCPQCGVRFRVPPVGTSEDTRVEKADASAPPASAPANPSPASKSGPSGVKPKEPQIEFLCPNGHRLNGPASLQGRPGQCPECGSKFRVPTYDGVSEDEELEQDINSGGVYEDESDAGADEATPEEEENEEEENYQLDFIGKDEEKEEEEPAEEEDGEEVDEEAVETPPVANPPQAWDSFLAALWPHKSSDVVVEIVLNDGAKIVADQYSPTLASQGCGLFAVKDTNGTHTIHAVLWSSVSRIVVQGLKQLPGDLFD